MINIGQAIKDELIHQERTAGWLACKLGCNRQFVYRLLMKNSIDSSLLLRISIILNRNFFKEYSEQYNSLITSKQ
ncbi:MAG: XRE family transcriptional regulator [Muribaculaceae bacterium]|nr:XRE family transcriptional regulator [Muribaculaceae bacterium]